MKEASHPQVKMLVAFSPVHQSIDSTELKVAVIEQSSMVERETEDTARGYTTQL